jgi:Arc/MetJ-type ribon-helix-helix transcriptional regulator
MAKDRITVTLPPEYIKWLEEKVEAHDYGSISHGITQLIRDAIKRESAKK